MHHEPHKLLEKSRELRRRQTPAERAMWSTLRGRRFMNLKFRRQLEIGDYIVEFFCEELLVNPEIVFERIMRMVEVLKRLPHP